MILIEGPAGIITFVSVLSELEQAYPDKLIQALQAGYQAIEAGKASVDAWNCDSYNGRFNAYAIAKKRRIPIRGVLIQKIVLFNGVSRQYGRMGDS